MRALGRADRGRRDAQVAAALDSLPYAFCLYDADERLVFASAGFRTIFEQPVERAPRGCMRAR